MTALATSTDVEARLGRTLTAAETARIDGLLADVSAAVRGAAGQTFTAATTTVTLHSRTGEIRLPERPVTAVTAVTDLDNNSISYQWDGLDRISVSIPGVFYTFETDGYPKPLTVKITYTHGGTVPDDIVAVVCQITARVLGQDPTTSGIQQEAIGGYFYTIGTAAAAGGVGMLPPEQQVCARYRRVGGTAWIAP